MEYVSQIPLGAVVAVCSLIFTVVGVFWATFRLGWKVSGMLEKQRVERKEDLGKMATELRNMIDAHESSGFQRHLENLQRFTQIEIRLARMGNGSEDRH